MILLNFLPFETFCLFVFIFHFFFKFMQKEMECHHSSFLFSRYARGKLLDSSKQCVNRTHAKHLQVYQYTARACAVSAWEDSPAAQPQLPLSPGGFFSPALVEVGKFHPSRAQRLKQRFLLNQFIRSYALTEGTLVEESCLFLG